MNLSRRIQRFFFNHEDKTDVIFLVGSAAVVAICIPLALWTLYLLYVVATGNYHQ
jgi:hypothetical protein